MGSVGINCLKLRREREELKRIETGRKLLNFEMGTSVGRNGHIGRKRALSNYLRLIVDC